MRCIMHGQVVGNGKLTCETYSLQKGYEVTIPLPQKIKYATLFIYFYASNGQYTSMFCTLDDGQINNKTQSGSGTYTISFDKDTHSLYINLDGWGASWGDLKISY